MSYKTELQTYCQRNGLKLPVYNSSFSNNMWTSNVLVSDLLNDTFIYWGSSHKKKVDADDSAANDAIRHLYGGLEKETRVKMTISGKLNDEEKKCKFFCLIDYGDDCYFLNYKFLDTSQSEALIYKFTGNSVSHNSKLPGEVAISLFVGLIISQLEDCKILILTKKPFGKLLSETFDNVLSADKEADAIKILNDSGYRCFNKTTIFWE